MSTKRLRREKRVERRWRGSYSDDDDIEDGEFHVERILDKRIRKGRVEYFLKWKGFGENENTWEPIKNLRCPEIIQEFERNRRQHAEQLANDRKRKSDEMNQNLAKRKVYGFDRGLIVDEIIGATEFKGQIMLLVKWQGKNSAELVPSFMANNKCPQKVISFYEKHTQWKQ